jgi:hypothetical protein
MLFAPLEAMMRSPTAYLRFTPAVAESVKVLLPVPMVLLLDEVSNPYNSPSEWT